MTAIFYSSAAIVMLLSRSIFDLAGAQLDAVGGGVLLDIRDPLGSRIGRGRRPARAARRRPCLIDDVQIAT